MQKCSNGKNMTHIIKVIKQCNIKTLNGKKQDVGKLVVKNPGGENSLQESVTENSDGKTKLQRNIYGKKSLNKKIKKKV